MKKNADALIECGLVSEWSEFGPCSGGSRTATRTCSVMSDSGEVDVAAENCGLVSADLSISTSCAQLGEWSHWTICSSGERSKSRKCLSGTSVSDASACGVSNSDLSSTESCEDPLKWKKSMSIKLSSSRGRDSDNAIMAPYDMSWAVGKYGKPYEKCCTTPRAAYDGLHNANCASLGGSDNAGNPYFNEATGECISNIKTKSLPGSYLMVDLGQPYNVSSVNVAVNPLYVNAYKTLRLIVAEDEYNDSGRSNHLTGGTDCGLSDNLNSNGQPTSGIISYACPGGAYGQYAWLANPEDNSDMVTIDEVWVFAKTAVFNSFWAEWNFPEPCKGPDGGGCTEQSYSGTVTRRRQCIPPEAIGSPNCPAGGESETAGMISCPNRCVEAGNWEYTECSATCGGTRRKLRSCKNSGHGLPDKDYCDSPSFKDDTLYPCGGKCWEPWDASSIITPTNGDAHFSHIDCGTEGEDYTIETDGRWKVRFGVVCKYHCNDGYRPGTSKAAVQSGISRTMKLKGGFSWEYMNTATSTTSKRDDSSGAFHGTNEDPFGSSALNTKCFKISGVHPNRMSCPDQDVVNAKFGLNGATCTDGNNPGSICSHTCTQDWRPVDLSSMTSICYCEAKCLWFNTFSGNGKNWKKSGQIKCRKTDCGRPSNTNLSWNTGFWGGQCFRDDDQSKVYDESIVLETANGSDDMDENSYWPIGSYCRETNCQDGKQITDYQPSCLCDYFATSLIISS